VWGIGIHPFIKTDRALLAGFPTLREVVLVWAIITDADGPTAIAGVLCDFVVGDIPVVKSLHIVPSFFSKQFQSRLVALLRHTLKRLDRREVQSACRNDAEMFRPQHLARLALVSDFFRTVI
jgi:hypothetical protein